MNPSAGDHNVKLAVSTTLGSLVATIISVCFAISALITPNRN
jgi:hypothetical protein